MYWDRYIRRDNPRRIEPLDKPLDTYIMLDTETTGLNPEEGATLIEIGAFLVQPGNENSRPRFEQLIDPMVLILLGAATISFFLGDTKSVFAIMAIVTINGWNRLAITFRTPVGNYQSKYAAQEIV